MAPAWAQGKPCKHGRVPALAALLPLLLAAALVQQALGQEETCLVRITYDAMDVEFAFGLDTELWGDSKEADGVTVEPEGCFSPDGTATAVEIRLVQSSSNKDQPWPAESDQYPFLKSGSTLFSNFNPDTLTELRIRGCIDSTGSGGE